MKFATLITPSSVYTSQTYKIYNFKKVNVKTYITCILLIKPIKTFIFIKACFFSVFFFFFVLFCFVFAESPADFYMANMLFSVACKCFENAFFEELLVLCVFWLAQGTKIAGCIQESDQDTGIIVKIALSGITSW